MELQEYNEIVQHWIAQVLESRGLDAERTLKCSTDLISYGHKNGDCSLIGFGHYYSAETYYCLNDGEQFFREISRAITYLNQAKDWERLAYCYNFLGIWALNRGNMPLAQDYYYTGIKICNDHELHKTKVALEINMATLDIDSLRYDHARECLENASSYMKELKTDPEYHSYMVFIYIGLAKCYIKQGEFEPAWDLFLRITQNHWDAISRIDQLSVLCTQALYYYHTNETIRRDQCIARVRTELVPQLPALDVFDDLYNYAQLLLDVDKDDEFWEVVDLLEPLIRDCKLTNLQMKLISLKIHYYRKHGQSAEYLQAAGLYFEYSDKMSDENRTMVNNVMNLRQNLEMANRVRKEVEAQNVILQEKSEMDPLTKIGNRFRLNDYSEKIYHRALEMREGIAVEILDVDYFKEYNDNYGHQAGDECLKAVADAIKQMVTNYEGFCARYGGDEFVIIYENLSWEEAQSRAAELKKIMLDKQIEHLYSKAIPQVTISQGLCWGVAQKGARIWDFMHRADGMLYKVKEISRNNYCVGKVESAEDFVIGE